MFSLLSVKGIFKWLRLKMKGEKVFVGGQCNLCGRCCKHIYLFDADGRIIKNKKHFERMCQVFPDSRRFKVIAEEPAALVFECSMLTEEGICGDHENRPALCRNYPSPMMYYSNFTLNDYCGYTIQAGKPFDSHFEKAMKEQV